MKKTNALRLLDQKKIAYTAIPYETLDGLNDGVSVAHKTGKPEEVVYKTLVLSGLKANYVGIIPVAASLDLKKIALVFGEKGLHMLPHKDLLHVTGYEKGGCSPLGMKKHLATCIDESCLELEEIVVSAGAVGLQLQIKTRDLIDLIQAKTAAITM